MSYARQSRAALDALTRNARHRRSRAREL